MSKILKKCYPTLHLFDKEYKCESDEEYYFASWCKELIEKGVLLECYRPDKIIVNAPFLFSSIINYKKINIKHEFQLVNESAYSGDMYLKWNPDYHGIFYINNNDIVSAKISPRSTFCKKNFLFYCMSDNKSFVDVKGTFDNPRQIPFSRTQQILAIINIYVQKVIPLGKKGLFAKTFAPSEYLYTPATKKRRNGFRSIDEFLLNAKSILSNETKNVTN